MSQERVMRIVERNGSGWAVQYGYWENRGANRRFQALVEWPADSYNQAHAVVAREKINLILSPVPVDATPLPEQPFVRRAIKESQSDSADVVRRAVAGLPDPLPTAETSHEELGLEAPPMRRGNGRQFGVYLPEPIYQKLCAMAVCAGTTRNQILEALLVTAGGDDAEA